MYIVIKNNDKFDFSDGKLICENDTWFLKFHSDETFEMRLYMVFYDESTAQEYANDINKDILNQAKYMEDYRGFKDDEPRLYRVIKYSN
jgi:hypothetical protein